MTSGKIQVVPVARRRLVVEVDVSVCPICYPICYLVTEGRYAEVEHHADDHHVWKIDE
jgi:hypothetical protein